MIPIFEKKQKPYIWSVLVIICPKIPKRIQLLQFYASIPRKDLGKNQKNCFMNGFTGINHVIDRLFAFSCFS